MESDLECTAVERWDRTNERAVINMVSHDTANAMLAAAQAAPDLFGMDQRDLYLRLRNDHMLPSPTDNRLRLAFWLEYERALEAGTKMNMQSVYAGITTGPTWTQKIIHSPTRMAWILTPPTDYIVKISEALEFGIDRLRDMLELDPRSPSGKLDVKLMELQAKITWMLEQRVKGAVVQRIEQKTMGLNIHTTDKAVAKAAMENSMEGLEKRLRDIEKKERLLMSLPDSGVSTTVVVAEDVKDADGSA